MKKNETNLGEQRLLLQKKQTLYKNPEDATVRVHGNGFIQAETPDGGKIHIWHDTAPRQRVATVIHNHNHTFKSTILVGELVNVEYNISDCYNLNKTRYEGYQAIPRKGKDTVLEKTTAAVSADIVRTMHMVPGSSYVLPGEHELYHETIPMTDLVITKVDRVGETKSFLPTVLVPLGSLPDNDFDRYNYYNEASTIYNLAISHLINIEMIDKLV